MEINKVIRGLKLIHKISTTKIIHKLSTVKPVTSKYFNIDGLQPSEQNLNQKKSESLPTSG